MARQVSISQLLVEGKNDQHVIMALCKRHSISETFTIELPNDQVQGIEELTSSLQVRLKISGLRSLGIVIDADQALQSRWESISSRLRLAGYRDVPHLPSSQGTIIVQENLPTVGIWVMPNNSLPGMLEDFVSYLIPADDKLLPKAYAIVAEIEQENLNIYPHYTFSQSSYSYMACMAKNTGPAYGSIDQFTSTSSRYPNSSPIC